MTYDSTLKYLVEKYPQAFTRWLFNQQPAEDIEILNTELSTEPIRADALFFVRVADAILHLEFQTLPQSEPPLPLRMLDYWVRLYRQYRCDIEQVIIFLKPTRLAGVFENQFTERNLSFRYRVIRIWECDPEPLLTTPGLLPLAVLAQAEVPETLLSQVAAKIDMIEDRQQQRNLSACVQLLAGVKFDEQLIQAYFREDMMQESVVYQRIIRQGLEQGKHNEVKLIIRLLNRRIGQLNPQLHNQIEQLSFEQLEDLGEALLDFETEVDLTNWLNQFRDK